MTITAESQGWRVACDWLLGCDRVAVVHNEDADQVRATAAGRGWTAGKRDTDYCPDHSGTEAAR